MFDSESTKLEFWILEHLQSHRIESAYFRGEVSPERHRFNRVSHWNIAKNSIVDSEERIIGQVNEAKKMWSALCALVSTMLCLLFVLVYIHFRRTYQLWTQQGVPTLPATFPAGNLGTEMARTNFGLIAIEFYKKLKSTGDYAGLFFLNKPVLFVLSPEFAKTVLIRDFKYFTNRGVYFNKANDPVSANLFFIENHDWRKLRTKMTPTFTSGKIKTMFPTMYDVGAELQRHMDVQCDASSMGGVDIEITDVMARYNTDIIVSCAFGMQCNSLFDANSEFRAIGKKMLAFDRWRLYKLYGAMLFRGPARAMGFRLLDDDVSKFITAMCKQTIDLRRTENIERKDFMQLMIDMYDDGTTPTTTTNRNGDTLSLDEIAANVFLFFFAGFETSSTAMTYTLFEMALNPRIQNRVRDEINDISAKYNDEISYDRLTEMTLLDRVIFGEFGG